MFVALGMRYVCGTRRFTSFDQSNEKAFMSSVSGHKYLELNLLDFRLISEANLSIDIFPQRCSRILIKRWVVYQSSKSIVLEILSASLLYSRPTQKTSKCMLWLKVRLKMFKASYRYVFYCFHTLFVELWNCLYTKRYIYFRTA